MKKLVAVLLPVTLACGCVGLIGSKNISAKETKVETVTFEVEADQVEQGLTQEQLAEIAEDNGYINIKINKDGSATVTVDAKKGKELAKREIEVVKENIKKIVAGDNAITNIKVDDKFENFEIFTKNDGMTYTEETCAESCIQEIEKVHSLKGIKNYEYHVVVKNADTKEVLSETENSSSSFSFSLF